MSEYVSHEDMMSIPANEVADLCKVPSHPVVSVIMVTYNHDQFLAQAIESVIMQRCSFPIELLIGDDCSTDRTRDICLDYQRRYPHLIRFITSDTNVNPYNNMLRLYGRSKGRYVATCDGDDYWTSAEKLQRQVEYLDAHPECSLCFHHAQVRYECPANDPHHFPIQDLSHITLSDVVERAWFIPTCSTVYRGSSLKQLPKKFQEFPCGDMPTWILLASQGELFGMRESMAVYRKHAGGLSVNHSQPQKAIAFYLEYIKMLGSLNEMLNWQYDHVFRRKQKYMRGLIAYMRIKHALPQSIAGYLAGAEFFLRHTIPRRVKERITHIGQQEPAWPWCGKIDLAPSQSPVCTSAGEGDLVEGSIMTSQNNRPC